MACSIRRHSMEHLELYDLDQLTMLPTANKRLPPPIPPPRQRRQQLAASSTFERYQFLCDISRLKTDPIYAATPMFRTIPSTTHVRRPRQLLGSHLPTDIIKPVSNRSSDSPDSDNDETKKETKEDESSDADKDDKDDESSDDDKDGKDDDDDHDDDHDEKDDSSSSSSDDNVPDDNDDDDDNKGVVEQIFNRDKNSVRKT